jgi:TIR domain
VARAFISYRRDDSAAVARALYLQLKERFGSGQLFMDVNSMQPGEPWPERIQSELQTATVVLVLIGRKWLFAADQYGKGESTMNRIGCARRSSKRWSATSASCRSSSSRRRIFLSPPDCRTF